MSVFVLCVLFIVWRKCEHWNIGKEDPEPQCYNFMGLYCKWVGSYYFKNDQKVKIQSLVFLPHFVKRRARQRTSKEDHIKKHQAKCEHLFQ